jgi:hypothetical protein
MGKHPDAKFKSLDTSSRVEELDDSCEGDAQAREFYSNIAKQQNITKYF